MISTNPPQCQYCANYIRERSRVSRCKAFPKEIPEELYTACFDHTKPYPGDGGIRYKKYTGNLDLDGRVMI